MQVLCLGIQIGVYSGMLFLIYLAWLEWTRPESPSPRMQGKKLAWHGLPGLGLALLFAFLFAAPQLWPSLRYLPFSQRNSLSYARFIQDSLHPKEILNWFIPGYYGWQTPGYHGYLPERYYTDYFGLLPWALACAGLAANWKLPKAEGRVWVAMLAFALMLGMGKWFPLHHLFFHLPLFSKFEAWSRILVLVPFCVAALASLGWDALGQGGRAKWKSPAAQAALAFCLAAVALGLVCLIHPGSAEAGGRQSLAMLGDSVFKDLLLCTLMTGLLFVRSRSLAGGALALGLALGLHAADESEVLRRFVLFRPAAPLTQAPDFAEALPSPDSAEPWRLAEGQEVWGTDSAMKFGYESVMGYHGFPLAGPQRLEEALKSNQQRWLNLMNARYFLSRSPLPLPLLRDGEVKVYANPGAFPRAWLVGKAELLQNQDQAFARLADPKLDLAHVALLQQGAALPPQWKGGRPAPWKIDWLGRSDNSLDLVVHASSDALLMLSNAWYPSWKVLVDGNPSPLLQADGALQAVALSAGEHRVSLRCREELFYWGCGAFLAALAGLFMLWRRERRLYNH
jgi:hypothetical protein